VTTLIWTGITLGAVYALVALTFNATLNGAGVLNFAQPQFFMVGGLLGYQVQAVWHLPLLVACLTCGVLGGVLGYVEELIAIRPLRDAGHMALVTTVGASVIIQGAAIVFWGTDARSVTFPGGASPYHVFGAPILPVDIVLIALAILVTAGLHLRAQITPAGLAERAAVMDADAARLRGVNVRRVATASFVVSGIVGAAVGPLVAVKTGASTAAGDNLIMLGFIAIAIGGFGSYLGCLIGGVLVGILQVYCSRYLGNDYPLIVLLAVLLVVLLVRPTGLLGSKALRHV
jgi:branched-chain amino acid transport system permease protein